MKRVRFTKRKTADNEFLFTFPADAKECFAKRKKIEGTKGFVKEVTTIPDKLAFKLITFNNFFKD